jgi:hypothetical protein
MAVASGSENDSTSVDDPAGSYFTVGVGAYEGEQQDGFNRQDVSQYATVDYYDTVLDVSFCSWCSEHGPNSKFCPDVYAHGKFSPTYNTSKTLENTSMAAPIVSAGSAVRFSVNSGDSHQTKLQRYEGMNQYPIYPDGASLLGEAFYAPDLI